MIISAQAVFPEISCYKNDNNSTPYRVFGINGLGMSGTNILSASWKRSRNEFSGQFNFVIKEDVYTNTYVGDDKLKAPFIDVIEPLDVITFKTDSNSQKPDFIGIVTDISITGSSNSFQKSISITGKSIDHLLEMYVISMDATAMLFAGTMASEEAEYNNFVKNFSATSDSVYIKDALNGVYAEFERIATKYPGISSTKIGEMIKNWMGTDFFDCDDQLKFEYPISSNLVTNSTIRFPDYMRNLLPQPLYEFHGYMVDGKQKVRCREVPFDADKWAALPLKPFPAEITTNYTLTRSNGEVYTVFVPYVEGSALSLEQYKVQATDYKGYPHSVVDEEKLAYYGYRPLNCNFIGFKTEGTAEKDMIEAFKALASRLAEWYSHLDDMYDANISVIPIKGVELPVLGGRALFGGGEFYVTGIDYNWSYGSSTTYKYQLERGANYKDGKFVKALTGLSRAYVEMQ